MAGRTACKAIAFQGNHCLEKPQAYSPIVADDNAADFLRLRADRFANVVDHLVERDLAIQLECGCSLANLHHVEDVARTRSAGHWSSFDQPSVFLKRGRIVSAEFCWVKVPTSAELTHLTQTIARREPLRLGLVAHQAATSHHE